MDRRTVCPLCTHRRRRTRATAVTPDDAGGAIVAWAGTHGTGPTSNIYAQRVDRFGAIGEAEPVDHRGRTTWPATRAGQVVVEWTASYLDADPAFDIESLLGVAPGARAARRRPQPARRSAAARRRPAAPRPARHDPRRADRRTGSTWAASRRRAREGYSFVAATTDRLDRRAPTRTRCSWSRRARHGGYRTAGTPRPTRATRWTTSRRPCRSPFTGDYAAGVTHAAVGRQPGAPTSPPSGSTAAARSTSCPTPGNLVATPDRPATWTPPARPRYYKLCAVDVHGNVSPYAMLLPSGTVDVPGAGAAARAGALARRRPTRCAARPRCGWRCRARRASRSRSTTSRAAACARCSPARSRRASTRVTLGRPRRGRARACRAGCTSCAARSRAASSRAGSPRSADGPAGTDHGAPAPGRGAACVARPGTLITPRHERPGPQVRRHLGGRPRAHPRRGPPGGGRPRRRGTTCVVVVSAMGQTTDELLRLAREVSPEPQPARAGHAAHHRRARQHGAAGHGARATSACPPSRSPARRAASSPTAGTARRASSRCARSGCARELAQGKVVIVAGFQGVNPRHEGDHHAGPRRLGHHRGGAGRRASAAPAARSTPTSPACSPPTRAPCPGRGSSPSSTTACARRSPTWAAASCTRAAWTWRRARACRSWCARRSTSRPAPRSETSTWKDPGWRRWRTATTARSPSRRARRAAPARPAP